MEESRKLVGLFCRILLQQEGQPDLGAKIDPMDGVDSEPWKTCWRKVDAGIADWNPLDSDPHCDTNCRKIGGDIEQTPARDSVKAADGLHGTHEE